MNNVSLIQLFTKVCPRCKISKGVSAYNKCKTNKDGLSWMCRDCCKVERVSRKEQIKTYHREYQNTLTDKERILKYARSSACSRGLEFTLTIDDIPPIPLYCPILGFEISLRHKNRNQTCSVDRIDPTKGYIPGNIVLISHKANTCKSNLTFDELEKLYLFYKQFNPE